MAHVPYVPFKDLFSPSPTPSSPSPQVTPLKVELGLSKEENPFAISRPRAGELSIRSSLRAPTSGFSNGGAPALPPPPGALASIRGQSPFKRGAEQYSSLRPQVKIYIKCTT